MKHLRHSILPLLLACAALGQNIDTLPTILGSAVDKANDKILIRDASVSAGTGALRAMEIDELVNVPGMFSSLEPALGNPAANGYLLSSTTGGVRSWVTPPTGGTWGSITGTLASQSDLSTALGLKVATSQLSTTGGASKVAQFTPAGQFQTSSNYTQGGGVLAGEGNVLLPDLQGLRWLKRDGTVSNAGLFHWQEHDAFGGEFIMQSPWRIAIIPNGPTQMGANDAGRMPRKVQLVSGSSSGANAAVEYMPSGALAWQTSAWNGSSNVVNEITAQAHALDTTGTNSILRFWDQSEVTGEDGGGNIYTVGRGDVTGNLIAEIYKDGIWSTGTAPAFVALTDGATITQTCSKYKTTQAASVTLGGNRSLAISGGIAGMRGVIYVTQDATGSRTLTPSGGTALGLSTTAGYTDRVAWEFDGVYYNFNLTLNVQREVIIADSDAAAFVTAASISSAPQKAAINTLVGSLKSASLWTRFYAIYPFVGGNATAHAKDLKATYNITWAGDPTHDVNGVTGDATDARGDTGINLFSLGATNSVSGYVYSKTTTPTDGAYLFGSTTATTRFALARSGTNLGYHGPNSQENSAVSASSDLSNHLAINRSSSTAAQIYVGATGASATDSVVAAPNGQLRLLCRESVGSPANYTNANLAFAAFGQSLTEAEWATFRAIIDTYQTALGRAN